MTQQQPPRKTAPPTSAPPDPRVVPARCAVDPSHPPVAWLDRDGEARCCACRPPGPAWTLLPPGASREDARAEAARVQDSFLRHFYPERGKTIPRPKIKPNYVWESWTAFRPVTTGEAP